MTLSPIATPHILTSATTALGGRVVSAGKTCQLTIPLTSIKRNNEIPKPQAKSENPNHLYGVVNIIVTVPESFFSCSIRSEIEKIEALKPSIDAWVNWRIFHKQLKDKVDQSTSEDFKDNSELEKAYDKLKSIAAEYSELVHEKGIKIDFEYRHYHTC